MTVQNDHEHLPPVEKGHRRAFKRCSCGCVGFYDYVPYSLSTAILVMPCGRDGKLAASIDEAEFLAATSTGGAA